MVYTFSQLGIPYHIFTFYTPFSPLSSERTSNFCPRSLEAISRIKHNKAEVAQYSNKARQTKRPSVFGTSFHGIPSFSNNHSTPNDTHDKICTKQRKYLNFRKCHVLQDVSPSACAHAWANIVLTEHQTAALAAKKTAKTWWNSLIPGIEVNRAKKKDVDNPAGNAHRTNRSTGTERRRWDRMKYGTQRGGMGTPDAERSRICKYCIAPMGRNNAPVTDRLCQHQK